MVFVVIVAPLGLRSLVTLPRRCSVAQLTLTVRRLTRTDCYFRTRCPFHPCLGALRSWLRPVVVFLVTPSADVDRAYARFAVAVSRISFVLLVLQAAVIVVVVRLPVAATYFMMDSLQRKKRCGNITNEQRTLLIEFMTKHNELLKGKFTSSFTMKDSVRLWNEITEILNSVNGAKKDWKGWRKCWHDFQSRSKKKHTVIKQSLAATGGGTQNTETMTSQEEQILNIMCKTSIHGHPDVEESSINILEESENDVMDVEYLNEYEEDIASQIGLSTSRSDSNNCNKLVSRETKAVVDNSSKKVSHEKENINKIQSNDTDVKQLKIFQDIEMSMNAKSCEQDKTSNQKKTVNTVKKELKNTVEVSTKLNNVYEKTYEMKKDYYKARLEYLQRSVEAKERIANSAERCNTC